MGRAGKHPVRNWCFPARSLRADLPILVRARDDAHLDELLDAGATEVIPETLEASLMLANQLMLLLEVPGNKVDEKINAVRGDRYRLLRGAFTRGGTKGAVDAHREPERMHSVILTAGAFAVGHRLEDLDLEDPPSGARRWRHRSHPRNLGSEPHACKPAYVVTGGSGE